MKIKLLLKIKDVVVKSYYSELKNKKDMGMPITLKDIESNPINKKVKKFIK